MDNIKWDLDGLLSVNDFLYLDELGWLFSKSNFDELFNYFTNVPDEKSDLFKEYSSLVYSNNPFHLHIDECLSAYKKTEKYTREMLLSVDSFSFTTNEEIYKHLGVYFLTILRRTVHSSACRLIVTELGEKRLCSYEDRKKLYHLLVETDDYDFIEYDEVAEEDVIDYLCF